MQRNSVIKWYKHVTNQSLLSIREYWNHYYENIVILVAFRLFVSTNIPNPSVDVHKQILGKMCPYIFDGCTMDVIIIHARIKVKPCQWKGSLVSCEENLSATIGQSLEKGFIISKEIVQILTHFHQNFGDDLKLLKKKNVLSACSYW